MLQFPQMYENRQAESSRGLVSHPTPAFWPADTAPSWLASVLQPEHPCPGCIGFTAWARPLGADWRVSLIFNLYISIYLCVRTRTCRSVQRLEDNSCGLKVSFYSVRPGDRTSGLAVTTPPSPQTVSQDPGQVRPQGWRLSLRCCGG